jgi:hypothetical protein
MIMKLLKGSKATHKQIYRLGEQADEKETRGETIEI